MLLKLFQAEGRFPRRTDDVPAAAVEAIAGQVGVAAAAWQGYDWRGRTIEYHRAQIRPALRFRKATLDDAKALGCWLDGQALALERRPDLLLAAARERFRSQHLEPPSPERPEWLVRSVPRRNEDAYWGCKPEPQKIPSPKLAASIWVRPDRPVPVTLSAVAGTLHRII